MGSCYTRKRRPGRRGRAACRVVRIARRASISSRTTRLTRPCPNRVMYCPAFCPRSRHDDDERLRRRERSIDCSVAAIRSASAAHGVGTGIDPCDLQATARSAAHSQLQNSPIARGSRIGRWCRGSGYPAAAGRPVRPGTACCRRPACCAAASRTPSPARQAGRKLAKSAIGPWARIKEALRPGRCRDRQNVVVGERLARQIRRRRVRRRRRKASRSGREDRLAAQTAPCS